MKAFVIKRNSRGGYLRTDSRFIHWCDNIVGADTYESREKAKKVLTYFSEQAKENDNYNPLYYDEKDNETFEICEIEINIRPIS